MHTPVQQPLICGSGSREHLPHERETVSKVIEACRDLVRRDTDARKCLRRVLVDRSTDMLDR